MSLSGNIQLETADCPLCGAGNGKPTRFDFTPYKLARCAECGLYFCATRLKPEDVAKLYAHHDYFEGQGYDSYAAQEPALRLTFRRFLKKLNAAFPLQGALLEIGCGYGYLLDEARPYFQQRVGTDFSPQAVKQAATYGAKIYQGDIDGLPRDDRYDCIILAHVIEHVYRPVPLLRAIRDKLKAGGVVAVATPNIGSLWFPIMGRKWASFKIPEHVAFYERPTLNRLLASAGFRDIRTIPYLHAFPLALIANKLAARMPARMGRWSCWIPGTTIAMAARN
ncbi:MAG: class I SAM-dependent methyltransferase [Kiritimatiellaeota bacterium]|nr:class I SAM-dependent methyltransferase [Kiritimatiellota bacterium]